MSIRYSGVVSVEVDDGANDSERQGAEGDHETGAVYIDFDPNDHRERHGLTRKALVCVDYSVDGEVVGIELLFEDGGL